jgi:hypothetical protein
MPQNLTPSSSDEIITSLKNEIAKLKAKSSGIQSELEKLIHRSDWASEREQFHNDIWEIFFSWKGSMLDSKGMVQALANRGQFSHHEPTNRERLNTSVSIEHRTPASPKPGHP